MNVRDINMETALSWLSYRRSDLLMLVPLEPLLRLTPAVRSVTWLFLECDLSIDSIWTRSALSSSRSSRFSRLNHVSSFSFILHTYFAALCSSPSSVRQSLTIYFPLHSLLLSICAPFCLGVNTTRGARGSVVVKALFYKPEGRRFETR
jgi:hypothetical protein